MYLKYFYGFLIGSLVQFGIILISESLKISNLGVDITLKRIITHLAVGVAGGYLLMFILRYLNLHNIGYWTIGAIYGFILWAALMPIQAALGNINSPYEEGIGTIIASALAFIVYGIIAVYTIKRYGYTKHDANVEKESI